METQAGESWGLRDSRRKLRGGRRAAGRAAYQEVATMAREQAKAARTVLALKRADAQTQSKVRPTRRLIFSIRQPGGSQQGWCELLVSGLGSDDFF